jgi:hypothetical protein
MTDDDRVTNLFVATPRAPGVRPGMLRVWPRDPRAELGPLICTSLNDDEVVKVMTRLARGEDPGVDLEGHQLTEAEWARRRAAGGRQLYPVDDVEEVRRRKRRARKRRGHMR